MSFGLYPMSPNMKGDAVSQAKKLAEHAAKIMTLPLNVAERSSCQ